MHEQSVVIAQPEGAGRLVLLFHGVGSSAKNLAPLGEAVAHAYPGAVVVSVDAPHPSTLGSGREWFSVLGITEQDRPARIAQAMPLFSSSVADWQQRSGIGPENTTLVGFSQGAIMSLESTQTGIAPLAAQVVALAGRFAVPVRSAPAGVRFHLVHGADDGVVPARFAQEAAAGIEAAGGSVTLDVLPGLAHAIDARALSLLLGYLA
jgi:phospholipase/carboxylesterase